MLESEQHEQVADVQSDAVDRREQQRAVSEHDDHQGDESGDVDGAVAAGRSLRGDLVRIVAIEQANHSFADVKHIRELGKKFVRELEEFFINYHELTGKKYRVLDVKGPTKARRRIKDGMSAFRNESGLVC